MQDLKQLPSKTLVTRLEEMATQERKHQIEILRYLSELDERRVVVEMGYSSLWDFCRRRLKFSEATSTRRVNVARASRTFPALLTMLEDGRLSLGTASDLSHGLTDDNHVDLLATAAWKTAREVQRLVDPTNAKGGAKRDVIRRVVTPTMVAAPAALALVEDRSAIGPAPHRSTVPVMQSPAPATLRVSFNADERVVEKLERLQKILGVETLAEVCERAADLLLDKVDAVRRVEKRQQKAKAKAASANKAPTPGPPKIEARKPGRALADKVLVDSGMRCTFVSKDGVRCTESRFLTIDHVRPYALGGKSTDPTNLRCYCASHNLYVGRKTFGPLNVQTERSL